MAEAPEAQPRLVQARSGDSISKLLGTSDPGAIGAFARANGLEVGDSKIYAGRTYVLPDDLRTNEDQSRGTMMLRRDNARLDAMRTQQALAAAERSAPRPLGDLSGPLPQRYPARSSYSPAITRPRPPVRRMPLDNSWLAKAVLGQLAEYQAWAPGIGRGSVHAAKDAVELARLGYGLTHPIEDILANGPEHSAWVTLKRDADGVRNLASRAWEEPGMVGRGIRHELGEANRALNPFATPMADTLAGELARRRDIGLNQGELGFDVATTAYGGSGLRAVNGLHKVRAAARGAALVERYGPASRAALAAAYPEDAMASHYVGRAWAKEHGLPEWFVNGPLNVSRPPGLTKLEAYLYHAMYDRKFHGARLPAGSERRGWRFRDFDVERFGPVERLIYGAPGTLKGAIGGVAGSAAGAARYVMADNSEHSAGR